MTSTMLQRDRPVTLDDVFATDELQSRPSRQPDYPAEIAALHALAQRMVDHPDTMLDSLMDIALLLCGAGTAGLSVLETDVAGEPIFRWAALGGAMASQVGGSTPRHVSPCGTCLDCGTPQLYRYPERHFTYFQAAKPTVVEALVIPIRWKGEALGTIWIVSHDESRTFDREDVRVMESLASFTAAAISVLALRQEAAQATERLEQRVAERTAELTASHACLAEALAERTALERARSEWLRTLMNAQEDERRRVARELHDEMSQHLTGLSLGLQAVANAPLSARDGMRERLQELVARIDRGVHRLARGLRPAELDDLGLTSALGSFVDEWSKTTGIACDFSSRRCEARLPMPIETTLYRMAQEALTNVARHADARHASVLIDQQLGQVVLIVEDDGRGFDVAAAPAGAEAARFGLIGLRERAALLDGTVQIESSSVGTTVFATLPIAGDSRHG